MFYVVLCCLELVVVRGIPVHHGENGQPRASGQSSGAASVFRWEFLAGRLLFCGRRGIEDGDPCNMACLRSLERRFDSTSCDGIVLSDPLPSLCSVVVDNHVAVGRSLAHFGPADKSVVMRFYDVQWLQRSIRQQFRQRIGGLDPYNVLEFLKYRLSSVVNGSAFDRMPLLRQVLSFGISAVGV